MVGTAVNRHQIMYPGHSCLILLCLVFLVFGEVPIPRNVKMDSVNFKNILRWEPSFASDGNITYTAQYKLDTRIRNYNEVCKSILQTHCDFSMAKYDSLFRVRSELNGSVSSWVTIKFDPFIQTIISAPKVNVTSRAGFIDVNLTPLVQESNNSSLKSLYGSFRYKIIYWKESNPSEVKIVETEQNLEILHDLERWTNYCVKVQAFAPDFKNSGQFTQVICVNSQDNGTVDVWKLILVFMVSMVIFICVTIGAFYLTFTLYRTANYIFFPVYSIPEHMKEYFNKPFYNTPHLPKQPSDDCEESCEVLTFISEEEMSGKV